MLIASLMVSVVVVLGSAVVAMPLLVSIPGTYHRAFESKYHRWNRCQSDDVSGRGAAVG